jgi:hypothetical protein
LYCLSALRHICNQSLRAKVCRSSTELTTMTIINHCNQPSIPPPETLFVTEVTDRLGHVGPLGSTAVLEKVLRGQRFYITSLFPYLNRSSVFNSNKVSSHVLSSLQLILLLISDSTSTHYLEHQPTCTLVNTRLEGLLQLYRHR